MTDPNSRLVYSTATGVIKETAAPSQASPFAQDGIVRVRRETKGRKGAVSSPSMAYRLSSKR